MTSISAPTNRQKLDRLPNLASQIAALPAPASGERTILIVDDDITLCNLAAMILEGHGFKTLVAGNGFEALEQVHCHPETSAILLDLIMPSMNGEETFRQLRQLWPAIPIILISGFDLGEVGDRFESPLPEGFVQKPFTMASLTRTVVGLLS